jgi:D-alanyl-D-alanine dipeptidase
MSVVFDSKTKPSQNGYFRIGHIVLDIPPSNIITDRILNNTRKQTLRGKNEMFTKSGQARWDVTITWTAVRQGSDNSQWEKVQTILAIFKAAPFVEVENAHLRQIFAENDPFMKASRLAFALRQLKVETHPDIVDGLNVTLTMTYFNYLPYSLDFGYQSNTKSMGVDASQSQPFKDYIKGWMKANLTSSDDTFHAADWQVQLSKNPNNLTLNWKRYKALTVSTAPDLSNNNDTVAPTVAPAKPSVGIPIIPVPAKAAKGISAASAAYIQTLTPAAAAAATKWLTDIGSKGYTYTINSAFRPWAQQNNMYQAYIAAGGAAALKSGKVKYPVGSPGVLNANGSVTGGSAHEQGIALDISFSPQAFAYATQVGPQYGWSQPPKTINNDRVHWQYGSTRSIANAPINLINPNFQNTNPLTTESASVIPDAATLEKMADEGWEFDYFTNDTAYIFKPETVTVSKATGLTPGQISVLFVNNLAQIPLANYQYPTYQHLGTPASLVSIQMTSVGMQHGDVEPQHVGLTELTTMSYQLEDQFFKLRTFFKRFKSVFGMQAVFIENPVLNMLGIFGVLPEQLSTELIQDSSNMAQVTFLSHHYENMYEDIQPFKINGITGAYINTLKNILGGTSKTPPLNSLSGDEQKQLGKLLKYQNDATSSNTANLANWVLEAASNENNGNFIGQLTGNASMGLNVTDAQYAGTVLAAGGISGYPCLSTRAKSLTVSPSMTYVDYLVVTNLATTLAPTSSPGAPASFNEPLGIFGIGPVVPYYDSSYLNTLGTTAAKASDIASIYSSLLPFVVAADSEMQAEIQKLINSPVYKAEFQSAANGQNPSQSNSDHGAYKDFGLANGVSPSDYFINEQQAYIASVQQTLSNTASTMASASSAVNSVAPAVPAPGVPTSVANAAAASTPMTPVITTAGVPTDPNILIKMLNVPAYSMEEAFPTFKLFFMEDANNGIYYAFDQFYNYASVLEIEVIRPWDKPATAVIRITNLSNLFDHKLFDGTNVGKYEAALDRFTPTAEPGPATTQSGTKSTVTINPVTQAIIGNDLTDGYLPPGGASSSFPDILPALKYFPLQTGTKIQIRMGFNDDPDKLTPIFNGQVTELEPGDEGELIITAQSWLLELATISAGSSTNHNSFWSIAAVLDGKTGPAYGGIGILNDSGETSSVIRQLLTAPEAKHFGHWILNGVAPDQLLKGYAGWQRLAGQTANLLGATTIAGVINSAYDRSGENVMVNHYIDYTGEVQAGRTRSYTDASDSTIPFASVFEYYISNTLDLSLWELIRDVSRRYPEYLLLEKFYGFPYEADSTLVFANPLDWYYTRPRLLGDDEVTREATNNDTLFHLWYGPGDGSGQGEKLLNNAYDTALDAIDVTLLLGGASSFANFASESAFYLKVRSSKATAGQNYTSYQAALDKIQSEAIELTGVAPLPIQSSKLKDLGQALTKAKDAYQIFVANSPSTAQNSSGSVNANRIAPVRKYHFIDHQSIVHNGIKLNDKVYNNIKIAGPDGKHVKTLPANTQIPPQHLRTLDVSSRINDPDQNVLDQTVGQTGLFVLVAQSFLREEVGKMYRGEIILRGIPEIEPMDILILLDPSTGIVGPVEVEQVIHSFTQEMGYVTIVKPRLVVNINETAGASLSRQFGLVMSNVVRKINGTNPNVNATIGSKLSAVNNGINQQVSQLNNGTFTQGAVAGASLVTGGANPLIGLLDLLSTAAFYTWADANKDTNPILLQPLIRYNFPWLGGMQGFQITGLTGMAVARYKQWLDDEVYPLLDLWKAHKGLIPQN